MALKLLLIGAHVMATRTMMIEDLNVTSATYLLRVPVRGERAGTGATWSTAEAWIASGLVDAVTSNEMDDRKKAVRETENEVSTGGAPKKGQFFGNNSPNVGSLLRPDCGRTAKNKRNYYCRRPRRRWP